MKLLTKCITLLLILSCISCSKERTDWERYGFKGKVRSVTSKYLKGNASDDTTDGDMPHYSTDDIEQIYLADTEMPIKFAEFNSDGTLKEMQLWLYVYSVGDFLGDTDMPYPPMKQIHDGKYSDIHFTYGDERRKKMIYKDDKLEKIVFDSMRLGYIEAEKRSIYEPQFKQEMNFKYEKNKVIKTENFFDSSKSPQLQSEEKTTYTYSYTGKLRKKRISDKQITNYTFRDGKLTKVLQRDLDNNEFHTVKFDYTQRDKIKKIAIRGRRNYTFIYEYNEQNDMSRLEVIYDDEVHEALNFTYKYDTKGNWIRKEWEGFEIKRDIDYF